MSYTYIPSLVMFIVFIIGFMSSLVFYFYTLFQLYKQLKDLSNKNFLDKLLIFSSFGYATLLLIAFIVHNTLSGLYHDTNGTGPSDAELNFNLIEIVLTFIMLIISNQIMIKKNNH